MAEEYRHQCDLQSVTSSSTAIGSSNIGFQLLKKHGWKEGTGLGASEQGRLDPVETYIKKNKRGLGAEKVKRKTSQLSESHDHREKHKKELAPLSKKKTVSKRTRKMKEKERQLQEREFDRAFFREFWPENV